MKEIFAKRLKSARQLSEMSQDDLVQAIGKIVSKGISRHWFKFDKFDYYFPQFANLGEQEILNKEIYYNGDAADADIFGYQQRYAEYKYGSDIVAGDFTSTLDYWHMARKFASRPSLNSNFIVCNPTKRIFAISSASEDALWIQMYHSVNALRPMPYHSNPSLM